MLRAMAGPMIRVRIIVVMAVPVPDLVREICGRQAIHHLGRTNLMHCWSRTQERQGAQHHRQGDDEAKTIQECRSRHG